MSGPIELSRPERIAAIAEMRKHTRGAVAAVEDIIAAINKVRAQEVAWQVIDPGKFGSHANSEVVESWPIIYSPEVTE